MKQLYVDVSEPIGELSELVFNHFGKIPMGWTGIDKLTEYAHNEQFVERVFELYNYLSNTKDFLEGINPSQYYKIIYKFQLASKSLEYSVDKLTECYFYLSNYAVRVYNYYFEQVEQFVREHVFADIVDNKQAKKIALLSAALRSYSETLYCDEHTIAGEIYSPIIVQDGIVIARKYRWLNAKELRDELVGCPYKAINIYIKYKNIDKPPCTDIVGNLLTEINISKYMYGFYIEIVNIDDKVTTVDSCVAIDEVIQYFEYIIPLLSNNYKKMSLLDRLWIKILCEYYAMKPYTDVCGKDWRPILYPLDIKAFENINRPIVNANLKIENTYDEQEIKKMLFELNDPRVHWNEEMEVKR